MKKLIVFKLDTNDADYIEHTSLVSCVELEDIMLILKVIETWSKNNRYQHNFATYEEAYDQGISPKQIYVETGLLTQDQLEKIEFLFCLTVPFHSIRKFKVYDVINESETVYFR